ncbi:hypothetical protein ABZ839_20320 [Streptomyces cellulosae]
MDRARTAALAGRCLPWAGLVLLGVCAGALGLSEPRPPGQEAGAGVLAGATALAHRSPLTGAATGCAPTSPRGWTGPQRRPVRPPRPSPAPAAGWRPRRGPPRARASPSSRRRPTGTRTPRRTPSSNPPPTPPSAPARRSPLDLPDRQTQDPPTDRAPAPPEGADCRYYRASGALFVSVDHYRLCFDHEGRLVAKDVVPRTGGRPDAAHEESTR